VNSDEGAGARLAGAFRSLPPGARLAVVGALVVIGSLVLPWYGIDFTRLSTTAIGSFGFAHLALLVTVGAAVFLCAGVAAGRELPRPLREGELLIAAGVWAALLVGYLMLDRPDELGGSTRVGLRFGIFVALAGSLLIAAGGVRLRREEIAAARRRPSREPTEPDV
jgi:hypothetical protein